jgi:hypothetical protein
MDIFVNHPLSTDSYEYPEYDRISLVGGSNDENKPNGGFPPIYICSSQEEKDGKGNEDEKVKREFKSNKTAVSIKSILEKRRDKTPFIPT